MLFALKFYCNLKFINFLINPENKFILTEFFLGGGWAIIHYFIKVVFDFNV